MFLVGFLAGVFAYHFISEDIRIAIESLKLYKLRGEPERGLIGLVKRGLIEAMDL
jgi:hypothetical protein